MDGLQYSDPGTQAPSSLSLGQLHMFLQKPLQMGKERVEKAHLLLSHITLEMTHTISIHVPLVSTSHTVAYLLQEELENIDHGWAGTSQYWLYTVEGCIVGAHLWPQRVFQVYLH